MERHLIENLYLSNNSGEILDYLVDNRLMPKNFDKSTAISHIDHQDFKLILFLKKEDKKDEFLCFRFADFSRHPDSFGSLNQVFQELTENDAALYKKAMAKLEEMYYMIPVFRAYYYGKNNELKEETYL